MIIKLKILVLAAIGFCFGYILGTHLIPNVYCISLFRADELNISACENSFLVINSKTIGLGLGILIAGLFGWMTKRSFSKA